MMKAYINYKTPHLTAHYNPNCGCIQSHKKTNQRYFIIDVGSISTELRKFRTKAYCFGSYPYNDMWLEIDFQDRDFELAVLTFITKCLRQHYTPFRRVEPNIHC